MRCESVERPGRGVEAVEPLAVPHVHLATEASDELELLWAAGQREYLDIAVTHRDEPELRRGDVRDAVRVVGVGGEVAILGVVRHDARELPEDALTAASGGHARDQDIRAKA